MHKRSPRVWVLVAVILVLIAVHATLLALFFEARVSAVLVGGMVIVVVAKYVVRKCKRSAHRPNCLR